MAKPFGEKFICAIANYNNSFTFGPDKLSWEHLKHIIKDKICLKNIIIIANASFELGYWPDHFKKSTTIIIPKPNKSSYNSLKSFKPIVLLNTMGKLIEKVIRNRLQFQVISNNFIYQGQLGDLEFKSTTDTGIAFTYFICTGWIKNMLTSSLVFDIVQFFPLLNHCLLALILEKVRFKLRVVNFFSNYLVNRKTKYFWNNFSSSFFDINVGVGQGLALSPILSALYLSLFLHILEKHSKNLDLKISILSFVDDDLLITQSKSFQVSNTEIFHFSRLQGTFNPSSLNLSPIGSPSLILKDI